MSDTVIFAFGRFQPPTIGHEMMINKIVRAAQLARFDHAIFVSKTHDKKKNPLSIDDKISFLREMCPGVNFIACDEIVRTPVEAAKVLNAKHRNLVFASGADRIETLGKVIEKQNGIDYHYDSILLQSAGDRDPDSDGIEGVSGTAAREAALRGDFEAFRAMIPELISDERTKILLEMISNNKPKGISVNEKRVVLT